MEGPCGTFVGIKSSCQWAECCIPYCQSTAYYQRNIKILAWNRSQRFTFPTPFLSLVIRHSFSFVSFLVDKLLLPPFHLLQLPHLFCNGGHCESQNSHIQGTTWLPITSEWKIVFVTIFSWTAVVNISSWLLAAGFLLSSAMSSSFPPTSAGIVLSSYVE